MLTGGSSSCTQQKHVAWSAQLESCGTWPARVLWSLGAVQLAPRRILLSMLMVMLAREFSLLVVELLMLVWRREVLLLVLLLLLRVERSSVVVYIPVGHVLPPGRSAPPWRAASSPPLPWPAPTDHNHAGGSARATRRSHQGRSYQVSPLPRWLSQVEEAKPIVVWSVEELCSSNGCVADE